jgi:glycosyltransferase involved in cell wall biosynthesis
MLLDAEILRDAGHEVHFFCTDARPFWDERYPHADLFPRHVEYGALSPGARLSSLARPFWNREAVRALDALLDRIRPDVVHEHGTAFQLTPAVLRACERRRVPVAMTIHGAGLFCPAQGLVRGDGSTCADASCLGGRYHHALLHRCLPGGTAQALATVAVLAFYERARLYRNVSVWLCASEAMRGLAARAGLPRDRLLHVPYAFPRARFAAAAPRTPGRHFLFAGRLEREKGVHHLLEAMRALPSGTPLVVAGRGGEESALRAQAARLGLSGVEFVGWKEGAALAALQRDAIATVLPCDWFEAFGLVLVESFLQGRPVVASRVGGVPEVVEDGVDGLLVPPRDPAPLAGALARFLADPAAAAEMGLRGRAKTERRHGPDAHHDALLRAYTLARAPAGSA